MIDKKLVQFSLVYFSFMKFTLMTIIKKNIEINIKNKINIFKDIFVRPYRVPEAGKLEED